MRNIVLTLLLITIAQILYAQQERPEWVNVSPFSDDYNGSIDGFFTSATEGWIFQAAKYKAWKLYYTNDGAETFTPIFQFKDSLTMFLGIQMLDKEIGYATALWENNKFPYNDSIFLLKTNNGGNSWQNVELDTSFFNQFSYLNTNFYFIDELIGFSSQYLSCEGMAIFKTNDAAKNWQRSPILGIEESELLPLEMGGVTKFYFHNDTFGWALVSYAIDGGICLKTTDGGNSWNPVHNYGTDFFDLHFISPRKGGIVGFNSFFSNIFLTENNFESLSYENLFWDIEMHQYAQTIQYQNDSIIWITGNPPVIFRSTDSGRTFNRFQELYDSENMSFIKSINFFGNSGYALGYKTFYKFQDTLEIGLENKSLQLNYTFKLSPNPACNYVSINFPFKLSGYVYLYNMNGSLLSISQINNSDYLTIKLSEYKSGLYNVLLVDKKGNTWNQKLFKNN